MPPESSPSRWATVRAAAEAALDLSPGARAGYLDGACGDDAELRAEVERLVQACEDAESADDFLREPAAAFASPVLERMTAGDDDAGGVPGSLRAALDAEGYTVERELARGGMAVVYLARDRRHARSVAIKVLPRRVRAAVSAERFLAEIRVTARLTHPHVLPLHASGEADGRLYYVMPYVDGETLRQRIARERPLPLPVALQVLREVAGALDYAHRQGVVHRDVKPENVLLADGHAVVADFGIARAVSRAHADRGDDGASDAFRTHPGLTLGTPAYVAPEQARGDAAVDHRADLYALGVLAYEALAGAHPFGARTPEAMREAHRTETPAPLATRRADVPPALAALVMRLLAKEPDARPQRAADVVRALDAIDARARVGGGRGRRLALGVGVAVAAVAGVLAVRREATHADTPPVVAAERPAARPSVAVLPFVNTGGAAADEPLSDGLTDELISTLGRARGLDVIARTSVFALKGRRLGVRAVAETLGVATVLEGSLRRVGSRLRVTAQLVRAADGTVLWAGSYDRELRDVLAMQEQIARAIVGALEVRLVGAGGARPDRPPIADAAAYELFLKGRYVFNAGTGGDDLRQAGRFFEAAIARDSTLAPAHAGLSDVHARLAVFGYGRARDEMPRARAAALRALALDPTLAGAHVALAHTLFVHDFAPDSAERTLRRGLALDPGYVLGRTMLAVMLQFQGRFDEAHAQLDTAAALDPLASIVGTVRGRAYVSARRPDDAIRAMRAALELNPRADLAWQQLGFAYLQQGMTADALDALRRAAAISGPRDSAHLAYAHAVTGDRMAARRIVAALEASAARRHVPPFELAIAHVGLGDADAAFRWLDRALTERSIFPDAVSGTITLAPLHADPRWGAMLRRYRGAR